MQNLLDPAILFFVFALIAGCLRSNLEIPAQISRFLSLYLLMALGLKGGFSLAKSGMNSEILLSLGSAVLLALLVPVLNFQVLKRLLPPFDAAAVAATYGSVSAVTFITAAQVLENSHTPFGGHMAAGMALMESPAIILAVIFTNHLRYKTQQGKGVAATPFSKILHESFTDGTQMLLLGAMIIGILTGEAGQAAMKPFSGDLFKGMLSFFLLDMGLMAARNLGSLKGKSPWLIAFGIVGPLVNASLACGLAWLLQLPVGDGTLLMVLAASASYIAVPAVLKYAVPEANPSIYFGLSLGLTFPFNILFGIQLYSWVAGRVLV